MGILRLTYVETTDGEVSDYCLPTSEFERFNSSILDLGDVSKDGQYFDALAAIFDLEGFTSFCNQIDPHLVIPEYLNEFLNWLFLAIRREFIKEVEESQIRMWCEFPFYAKFMGDGVLFLWDTRNYPQEGIANIVVSLHLICEDYRYNFLPHIRRFVAKAPTRLRCGIARGQVISIGDGKDFVGPCINVASRLQKVGQFSFAFSKRGFTLERHFSEERQRAYVLVRLAIRGIGEEELLYVRRTEFESLSPDEQTQLLP